MAVKSVIDIEVNDEAFQRFYSLFEQYSGEVAAQPDSWKALGEAMGESGDKLAVGAVSGREALALAAAQATVIAEALEHATKAQDGLGSASKRSNVAMDALHKSAKGVGEAVSFVAGGLLKIAAFAGIGGLLGGLGIGDLASSGFNRYKQAGGLGISPGELASFQTNAQQFLGTSALESAANAQIDITKAGALATLGINYTAAQNMKTSDLAFETLKAAASAFNEDKKSGTPALQDPRIFWAAMEQFGLSIDEIRNAAAHPEALAQAQRDTRRDTRSLNFDDKVGAAWTELKKELDRAGFQIQTSLINNLVAFAPVVEKLTGEFVSFVTGLTNSKEFAKDVHWAADELGDLATFLKGVDWAKVGSEVVLMGDEIGAVAEKLKWLLPEPVSPADKVDQTLMDASGETSRWAVLPDNPLDLLKGDTMEQRAATAFAHKLIDLGRAVTGGVDATQDALRNANGGNAQALRDAAKGAGDAWQWLNSPIAAPAGAAVLQVAQEKGVDPLLALATAQQESGLTPTSKGDYEHGRPTSFGVFQLHEGGELGNLTPEQAYDPKTNANVALSEFAAVQKLSAAKALADFSKAVRLATPRATHDQIMAQAATPGMIAALAQRPGNPLKYARDVNALYEALVAQSPRASVPGVPPPIDTRPLAKAVAASNRAPATKPNVALPPVNLTPPAVNFPDPSQAALNAFSAAVRKANPGATHDQIMADAGTPGMYAALQAKPADPLAYADAVNRQAAPLSGPPAPSPLADAAKVAAPPQSVRAPLPAPFLAVPRETRATLAPKEAPNPQIVPQFDLDRVLRTVDADVAKYGRAWAEHLPKDVEHLVSLAHLPAAERASADRTGIDKALIRALRRTTARPLKVDITASANTAARFAVSTNAAAQS
jgi:hypothetical protein